MSSKEDQKKSDPAGVEVVVANNKVLDWLQADHCFSNLGIVLYTLILFAMLSYLSSKKTEIEELKDSLAKSQVEVISLKGSLMDQSPALTANDFTLGDPITLYWDSSGQELVTEELCLGKVLVEELRPGFYIHRRHADGSSVSCITNYPIVQLE